MQRNRLFSRTAHLYIVMYATASGGFVTISTRSLQRSTNTHAANIAAGLD